MRALALLMTLAASASAQVSFEEKRLATIPDELKTQWSQLGPDGKEYKHEFFPLFSPDGKRVAYAGAAGGKFQLMLGDRVLAKADFLDGLVFSANGARFAYRRGNRVDRQRERWSMVVDDKPGAEFDHIGMASFSPNGEHVAYWAGRGVRVSAQGPYEGGKYHLVMGSRKSEEFEPGGDTLMPVAWSPDNKTVAYPGYKDGATRMIVGGKLGPEVATVEGAVFSADGKQYAYAALQGGASLRWVVVVGTQVVSSDYDQANAPVWSADGKRLAYRAQKGGRLFPVIDGKKQGDGHDFIESIVFAPDGKSIAYSANTGGKADVQFAFSVTGGTWSVIANGKKGDDYDRVGVPAFSADGKRVAYRARKGETWTIVWDTGKSDVFDVASDPVFSPDGTRLAFGARVGKELWWKVIEAK